MKKKLLSIFCAAAAFFAVSCTPSESGSTSLIVDFTVNPEKPSAGAAVSFSSKTTGGSGAYTYKWTVGTTELAETGSQLVYTFRTGGAYTVRLDVTDATGKSAYKRKSIVVKAPAVADMGDLKINWLSKVMGYTSISSVGIADDGSIYMSNRSGKLYKWKSTGDLVWEKNLYDASTGVGTYGTPSIDTDGTVFIAAGEKDAKGVLKAFNPDGSVKWSFSQWYIAAGGTPLPGCTAPIPAIGTDNIYFGHTGTNGIVASINKATGARNGFAAPAGGARTGIAMTKNGDLVWYGGQFGLFGMNKSAIDNSGATPASNSWRIFSGGAEQATTNPMGGLALSIIDGTYYVSGVATDMKGTKVYTAKMSDGEVMSCVYIDDTGSQDQGGVVIDANDNVVAALNLTLGSSNGGIVVVNPKEEKVICRYRTAEKVSGSPAIDKAGNIHFGTESGYYYVVKPDGENCELLVKRNLTDLILADDRYKNETHLSKLYTAKIWCSPVIADDGKIYISFTDDETRAFGGVVCLSYEGCTGPANSDWPMYGQNRRHTNTL